MKIIIVGLIAFLLGAGAYWGYNNYQTLLKENLRLKKAEKSIPSSVDSNTEFPTGVPSPTENLKVGKIKGVLGYPAEGIPVLEVYAIDVSDKTKFFVVKTGENQNQFSIEGVAPGTYYVVAYSVNYNNLPGAYSKAVACGLSVECTDHSLIPVTVKAGETVSDVEVRDWYAPEGTFPPKP